MPPCKMRQELEELKSILKEKLMRINFELTKYKEETSDIYDKHIQEKTRIYHEIDRLTTTINNLKELDKDPIVCKELDRRYYKMYNKKTNDEFMNLQVDSDIKDLVESFLNRIDGNK